MASIEQEVPPTNYILHSNKNRLLQICRSCHPIQWFVYLSTQEFEQISNLCITLSIYPSFTIVVSSLIVGKKVG